MSKRVLLLTEKAFSKPAVQQTEDILTAAGYTLAKCENYKDRADALTAAATCDAMIIRSDKANAELLNAATDLKLIVRAGAGFDNIDLEAATAKGVVAMNTPGMNSNAVAELVFGMLVSHCRNGFDGTSGRELKGRTLGLYGFGMVGVCVGKIAKGYGMKVMALDPFLTAEEIKTKGAEPVSDTKELFSKCDFVSSHIPALPTTIGSINYDLISLLPKDGVLINTSRLEVVDEEGLIKVLTERPDLGYISDVQLADAAKVKGALGEDKFKKQVHFTPKKMGAQTAEANNNCCSAAAKQIVAFFENGDTSAQVNRVKGAPDPSKYKGVSTKTEGILGEGRKVNFGAGPCCLPLLVLQEAQEEMLNWNGTGGMSVMEMSHRGKDYDGIITRAIANLKKLLEVPDNFKIILLQGGATGQFAAVPLNLLGERGAEADYLVTGTWGTKAAEECNKYGKANVIFTTKSTKFTTIPPDSEWKDKLTPGAKYVHYCLNETVNGVEWDHVPDVPEGTILVGDHSSNFCSKKIDWKKHAVIYAGAQKNAGPAGLTITIVREDLLGKELSECPTAFSWKAYAPDSMYNTPPAYAIYMMGLYVKYMLDAGGIEKFNDLADKKSKMLYELMDASGGFYKAPVQPNCRSRMNIPFLIKNDDADLTKKFFKEAEAIGCTALAGHRSVGGCRASVYNALPLEGVAKLAQFMEKFQKANE